MSRFLLDTNILLGFVREAAWAIKARADYGLGDSETMVFTSVICRGEILALAEKLGWGKDKRRRLDDILETIPTLDINQPAILDAYARIYAWTRGRPAVSPDGAEPPQPARPMGQNDMWIAATTHVSNATLLSTDTDFEYLAGIWLAFTLVDQRVGTKRD